MAYLKRPVRRSQLISPWGVGSIVPFPEDESLMIAGLDMWYFGNNKREFVIKDERLEKRLGIKELRTPPDFRDPESDKINALIKIPAVRFPRWQYCPFCGTMMKTSYYSGQQRCDGYHWSQGRTCSEKKFKRKLIPERFIVICENGHVDDFPIMEWVHGNPSNPKPIKDTCRLRRSTGGVSASLSGVFYECSCGAKRSMAGATKDGALDSIYLCKGAKPWLGIENDEAHPCRKSVKVVQRGGLNVWFADIKSSIYIPVDDITTNKRITEILDEFYEMIISRRINDELDLDNIKMLALAKNVNYEELVDATLKRINNSDAEQEINEEISEESYRFAEYKVLVKSSGGDKMKFHSINYNINKYHPIIQPFFKSISLVPKLRETRAFVGFSRLQPNESQSIREKKQMLRTGNGEWLPAIEVFGEGIFFEFDSQSLEEWSKRTDVINRINSLNKSLNVMLESRNSKECNLNPKYVLIHTFAHILINQLSFECGYGSSSIRERIYCYRDREEENPMYGVLIYTASGDSEGSLGGLVRQGLPSRIEDTIISAVENAKWCSSDPVCIQSLGQGPDSCNLASCHNCALLPETCCENGNRLLDRALIVGTLDNTNIGFFDIDRID